MREHQAVSPHTILRFDEQMLLTIHLHGTPGVQAPVLHVRREYDYGIFDQLQTHLEKIWDSAAPIEALAVDPKPEPAHTPAKDKLLDQLDYVWRPER